MVQEPGQKGRDMKVKDLVDVVLDRVRLHYVVPVEYGCGEKDVFLTDAIESHAISAEFYDLKVISLFTLDEEDLIYVRVEPKLPFSDLEVSD